METTMIQIKKNTAKALKELKQYSRQSYDEIIGSLIMGSKAEPLTETDKKKIEEALTDVKKRKIHKIEDVAKELNIKLG